MTTLKDNIKLARFVTMQHRARGIPLASQNKLAADNRLMANQISDQLKILASQREETLLVIKQRDKYMELMIGLQHQLNVAEETVRQAKETK